MSFFIRNKRPAAKGNKRGGKIPAVSAKSRTAPKKSKRDEDEDEVPSESDEEIPSDEDAASLTDEDDVDEETPEEKRLRLTKEYLSQLDVEEKSRARDEIAEEEDDEDLVGKRLKKDLAEKSGKFHKRVADQYLSPQANDIVTLKGHRLPLTCIVITPDDRHVFTGSKDGCILKYDIATGKRLSVLRMPLGSALAAAAASGAGASGAAAKQKKKGSSAAQPHVPQVLCMTLSSDGKYLASGCQDSLIHIWNPETCIHVHAFRGHKGPVTAVAFRRSSHDLYSGAADRLVKVWNLDEMSYVETLFGHQDLVTGIDSLLRERAVSCGGRDNSVRVWKIAEESQLVFNGHGGSIDCVALIDEEHFVTGDDSNSLCLWSVMKKKPLCRQLNAHSSTATSSSSRWIATVASLTHTDIIASAGSSDGQLKLWKIEESFHKLSPLFSVALPGFINSLKFSQKGDYVVAAAGQEHRLGRWWRLKDGAKNVAYVVRLRQKQDSATPHLNGTAAQL